MERSNLSDAELKTLVIRMLKELSEDLNSIKDKVSSQSHGPVLGRGNYVRKWPKFSYWL